MVCIFGYDLPGYVVGFYTVINTKIIRFCLLWFVLRFYEKNQVLLFVVYVYAV